MSPRRASASLLVSAMLLAAGCQGVSAPPVTLSLWSHSGTVGEQAALTASVAAFESAHPGVQVDLKLLSEGDYTTLLQAAVAADELPDVIEIDGPLVASFAAQDALRPLEGLVSERVIDNMLPTLRSQGTWNERLWALGTFDSGLGLWADGQALRTAGVRVPKGVEDPWTEDEFAATLSALARADADGKVLDIRQDYGTGEWLTYGFVPLLASEGGSLEQLDSAPNRRALTTLASWRPFLDANADGMAFTDRRVPLSWVGHWTYRDYEQALGEDLVLLPLPDLGRGSRTGSGSWAWSVTRMSSHPEQAAQLLEWFAADREITAMTEANGAIPGSTTALAASSLHRRGGPLHLYVAQRAAGQAVPRPRTPDYPTLTAAFADAVAAVLGGTSPGKALAQAARDAGQS